jgi:hypothetical protein
MKRLAIGIAIFVGVATLVAFLVLSKAPDRQSVRTIDRTDGVAVTETTAQGTISSPENKTSADRKPKAVDYADRLKGSRNYLGFVRATIEAAKAGDPNAQYRVGKALAFCDETYRMYFEKKGERLTLDQGLQYAAKLHRSNAMAQSIYDRCHDLEDQNTGEFGIGEDWIAKAAKAGQPAAQATIAVITFSQEGFRASSYAPVNSTPESTNVDRGAELRAELRAAAESRDPEALWKIGAAQGFLNQSYEDKVKNQFAWWLVSCQRGYDCSAEADWIKLECQDESFCTPQISGIDLIRNGSGTDWPDVQQRALDISAKLDAGQWNELGIEM